MFYLGQKWKSFWKTYPMWTMALCLILSAATFVLSIAQYRWSTPHNSLFLLLNGFLLVGSHSIRDGLCKNPVLIRIVRWALKEFNETSMKVFPQIFIDWQSDINMETMSIRFGVLFISSLLLCVLGLYFYPFLNS